MKSHLINIQIFEKVVNNAYAVLKMSLILFRCGLREWGSVYLLIFIKEGIRFL